MNLLVFAHKGEAQAFISADKLTLHSQHKNLWQGADYNMLLTGDNPKYTEAKLTKVLEVFKGSFTQIYNFGICAGLSKQVRLNTVYPVKVSFLYQDNKTHQNSFELSKDAQFNCISTDQVVKASDLKNSLKSHAQLADQELWGLAKAAQQKNIKLSSYKLVSDFAEENTNCENIKAQSAKYSKKLYEYYCALAKPML